MHQKEREIEPEDRGRVAALLRQLADRYEDPEGKVGAMLVATLLPEGICVLAGAVPGMEQGVVLRYGTQVNLALGNLLNVMTPEDDADKAIELASGLLRSVRGGDA